ncbi:hypothetical protein SAMN02910358_01035 [Lachnospiraceae bacterium XBB1006]|nr:hypothetical protein SAMN02910358_01035 [Lachnospiraceae bacterium XBB1006]
MRKKYIALVGALLATITVLIFSQWIYHQFPDDFEEIHSYLGKSKVEYQSEPGFGNDRLDIYSYTLSEDDSQVTYHALDEAFESNLEELTGMLTREVAENDADANGLIKRINNVVKAKGTTYMCISHTSMKKLYIYNAELNKGFCIILEI